MKPSAWMIFAFAALALGPLGCGAGRVSVAEGESGEAGETGELSAACIAEGELARAVLLPDAEIQGLRLFEPGGEALELPAGPPEGVDAPATLFSSVRGGFIAVASNYSIHEPGEESEGAVLRLYERETAALVWEREFLYRLHRPFVDAEGRVVAAGGWNSQLAPAGVLVVDGELEELPNFEPTGALGPTGWMVGWIVDDADETLGGGLHNPFSKELIQVTTGSQGWWGDGETIEYLDTSTPAPRWVRVGPEGETVFALGEVPELGAATTLRASAGDFRLFIEGTTGLLEPDAPVVLARLDLQSGELLEVIEPSLPPGLERFDCLGQAIVELDLDGRILFELRDAGAAQIHAWDPEAETWTALGLPMTGVEDIDIASRFGRVHEIQGIGAPSGCGPAQWSDPPASALEGSTIQLARIDPPLSVAIDAAYPGTVRVDEQERCAAWPVAEGIRVHDLDDGEELVLPFAGNFTSTSALFWLD